MSTLALELLRKYPIISEQVEAGELRVILRELEVTVKNNPSAAVVEFGCYIGTTSLFIRRMLDSLQSYGEFHVYDSFSGLPEKTSSDFSPIGERFIAGELAASRKEFENQFKKAGLRVPVIHKGWFSDIMPRAVPNNICFAYLDGDYYESIRDSLRLITPHLSRGACIVIDDYANLALPGAKRAVDEWCQKCQLTVRVEQSLAIILC